ncbi:MAG: PQQ-binding-like beta-propeller repeat protein [Polyangiaceae bacterium]
MPYRDSTPAQPLIVALGKSVFALEVKTGRRLWTWTEARTSSSAKVFVEGDRVYVLKLDVVSCLALATGEVLWQGEAPSADTLLVRSGFVFVGGAGVVKAFLPDGSTLWEEPFLGSGTDSVALVIEENATFEVD